MHYLLNYHQPIHENCIGCQQVKMDTDEWHNVNFVCKIFFDPLWIWEEKFCPEKDRHENHLCTWWRK